MMFGSKSSPYGQKNTGVYSPTHSPVSRKKLPSQLKNSPSASNKKPQGHHHRVNTENKENFSAFQIPKQQKSPKSSRSQKGSIKKNACPAATLHRAKNDSDSKVNPNKEGRKLLIEIGVSNLKPNRCVKVQNLQEDETDKKRDFDIETPKFKCSSNKIDDRLKKEREAKETQNCKYFSFGDEFKKKAAHSNGETCPNVQVQVGLKINHPSRALGQKVVQDNPKLVPRATDQRVQPSHQKSPLKFQFSNELGSSQTEKVNPKFTLASVKKKDAKVSKLKLTEAKLEERFLLLEKQSRLKKERQTFGFRK